MRFAKDNRKRKEAIRRFGHLYKRASVPMEECVYCGERRTCLDHVPPLSKLQYLDVPKLVKERFKFLLYPSCTDCNKYLSSKLHVDLIDRMGFLAQKYAEKADKIEIWSDEEIAEMGPNMRSVILSSQTRAQKFLKKASIISDRADKLEGRFDNE